MVREDSGITKLEQLDGKGYSLGIVGSGSEFICKTAVEASGIKPDVYVGSFTDAVDACKDNRVVGFAKALSGQFLDASMLDVQAVTPIHIISLTEEQIAGATRAIPGIVPVTLPANSLENYRDGKHPAINVIGYMSGETATSRISQDLGYKMWRAVIDHWDELVEAYLKAKGFDPLRDSMSIMVEVSKVTTPPPFHAGMVQIFEENGIQVPQSLIPPEYKR
ncbi:hypothetical protein ES703_122221 [subsurface metagenome]